MEYKPTEDLLNQLKKENASYEEYLKNNEDCFIDNDISAFWKNALSLTDMKKVDIINKANIGYTFFYDIIKGKKTPSRDVLIKIFIAIHGDADLLQEALRIYEWAALYPKIKRDSIILFAIHHGLSLAETDVLLQQNNEKALKML